MAAAATALLALFAAGYIYLHRAPKLTDKDTIVLADFTNTTGDPVFDETLRQGLAVQLQESPFLSLISDERIRKTLSLMDQPPDARLTADTARGVCVRTASAAVLEGSIATLGSQYVLGLRAKNCTTGDILADEQAQAKRKEDVLGALSQIASRLRTRLGESLATVEQHSTSLDEATTSSLEAWKAYGTASKVYFASGTAPSQPLFKRAIAIDPNFAMAHARLGINYSVLGESVLARESTLKAYQLRERASDSERFFITTMYDRHVTGNLEREQETLESWAQTYPRDPNPHGLLGGFATTSTGKYELSIEASGKAIALDPDLAPPYGSQGFSYIYVDRLADAEAAVRRATERKLSSAELSDSALLHRLRARWLRGNETRGRAREKPVVWQVLGRYVFTHGGARPGSLRSIAGRQADVTRSRGPRAAVRPTRAGGHVRSGRRHMGGFLRKCGRSQPQRGQSPRDGAGARCRLCRRVRAGRFG